MSRPRYFWLEPGRPDTEEGLRARVADPVWFLTRQWQLGEHQGDDAASPVAVTAAPRHVPVRYDVARPDLDPTVVPAEAVLEAEPGQGELEDGLVVCTHVSNFAAHGPGEPSRHR